MRSLRPVCRLISTQAAYKAELDSLSVHIADERAAALERNVFSPRVRHNACAWWHFVFGKCPICTAVSATWTRSEIPLL
eukprot:6478343-Amphidinium_carterae.1